MERKTYSAFETKITDEAQGIVETLFSTAGVLDDGDDVVWPGAFSKTFLERGTRIKVLDQHRTDSVMAVIGKPLAFKEIDRADLPSSVLAAFPEATGAAWARVQFLMGTPEGRGAFERIKANAISEWSFGYDAMQADYSPVARKDGSVVNARNLREVKLYELSPVLWGLNPATSTLSAKASGPGEAKPWRAVRADDGKWRVYKLDADGQPTGDALGTHDTEEEAQAQLRALYASERSAGAGAGVPGSGGVTLAEGPGADETKVQKTEADGEHPASHYLVVEDAAKPSTWHLRVLGPDGKPDHGLMGGAWAALHGGYRGNVYEGPGKQEAIRKLTALYRSEEMDVPGKAGGPVTEEKTGRVLAKRNAERLVRALTELNDVLKDAGLLEVPEDADSDAEKSAAEAMIAANGPNVAPPTPAGAGPDAETPAYDAAVAELCSLELDILKIAGG